MVEWLALSVFVASLVTWICIRFWRRVRVSPLSWDEERVVAWLSEPVHRSHLRFFRSLGTDGAIDDLIDRGIVGGSGTELDPYRLLTLAEGRGGP